MRIKEVEKLTHLSSQTIRFYEEKQLLNIGRDESGYRDYTMDDVNILLRIKLFRKCGLSIQEIVQIYNHEKSIEDILYRKISDYDKKNLELLNEKELCLQVIKANGNYQDIYEYLEVLDSNEYDEFVDEMIEYSHVSLARQIFMTIPLLGPILCTFMFLSMGQYHRLTIGVIVSIIATVFITLSWSRFLKNYRFEKENLLSGIKHFFGMFILLVIILMILFGVYIIMTMILKQIYMNEGVYILNQSRIYSFMYLLLGVEVVILFMSFIARFLKHRDYQNYNFVLPFVKRHFIFWILINVLCCYVSFFNVTTVNSQSIIHYSFFHPTGVVYQLSDIEKVETGFYKKGILFLHETGDFYYNVTMKDGQTISFEDCQTTKEFEENTYSELVALDQQIMQYRPIKISSVENSEYTMLDQVYIDRFISIIKNK